MYLVKKHQPYCLACRMPVPDDDGQWLIHELNLHEGNITIVHFSSILNIPILLKRLTGECSVFDTT